MIIDSQHLLDLQQVELLQQAGPPRLLPLPHRLEGVHLGAEAAVVVPRRVENVELGHLVVLGDLGDNRLQLVEGILHLYPPLPLHGVVELPLLLKLSMLSLLPFTGPNVIQATDFGPLRTSTFFMVILSHSLLHIFHIFSFLLNVLSKTSFLQNFSDKFFRTLWRS